MSGGKGVSARDNQSAEEICQPGHPSEGLRGILSRGIQPLLSADRREHQTPFYY